jgi:hypothetical protein
MSKSITHEWHKHWHENSNWRPWNNDAPGLHNRIFTDELAKKNPGPTGYSSAARILSEERCRAAPDQRRTKSGVVHIPEEIWD